VSQSRNWMRFDKFTTAHVESRGGLPVVEVGHERSEICARDYVEQFPLVGRKAWPDLGQVVDRIDVGNGFTAEWELALACGCRTWRRRERNTIYRLGSSGRAPLGSSGRAPQYPRRAARQISSGQIDRVHRKRRTGSLISTVRPCAGKSARQRWYRL
jgi:hypothetical protein